jgi:tRNA(Ile)-lysidine synthase
VIRYWLQHHEVLMPSTRVLHSLEHDMLNSADDRIPCTRWGDYAVHRHHDRLYLEKPYLPEHLDDRLQWNWNEPLQLPHQLGSLCLAAMADNTSPQLSVDHLPAQLEVRFRQGGEHLQLPGETFRRELKKLMNDAGVLPWWRGRIPLIYAGDQLVAVPALWVSAEFVAAGTQTRLQLQWLQREKAIFTVK